MCCPHPLPVQTVAAAARPISAPIPFPIQSQTRSPIPSLIPLRILIPIQGLFLNPIPTLKQRIQRRRVCKGPIAGHWTQVMRTSCPPSAQPQSGESNLVVDLANDTEKAASQEANAPSTTLHIVPADQALIN